MNWGQWIWLSHSLKPSSHTLTPLSNVWKYYFHKPCSQHYDLQTPYLAEYVNVVQKPTRHEGPIHTQRQYRIAMCFIENCWPNPTFWSSAIFTEGKLCHLPRVEVGIKSKRLSEEIFIKQWLSAALIMHFPGLFKLCERHTFHTYYEHALKTSLEKWTLGYVSRSSVLRAGLHVASKLN